MAKESSLPPSLIPHLYDRPQELRRLSPTNGSPGAQDDVELPGPIDTTRQTAQPLRPLISSSRPAAFPDARRQYSAYELGAHDPVSLHPPPVPDRPGPSSIHGSARRYRSPVGDPIYHSAVRQQPQAPPAYPGVHNLLPLAPAPGRWREGEAGPSSLVHSHQYGRQITPGLTLPQLNHRATEPASYSTARSHLQPGSYGYDRFREHPEYPHRPTPETPYVDSPPSRVSSRPPYGSSGEWPYGPSSDQPGEQEYLPPLQSAISSVGTGVDDGHLLPLRLKLPDDFEQNPRRTNFPKKIQIACGFCRKRKLRCDGNRPLCSNCKQRDNECKYEDVPKRRGPGKGTRGKKRTSKAGRVAQVREEEVDTSSRSSIDDFDEKTLAPSLRSRASIESGQTYGSRPPLPEKKRRRSGSRPSELPLPEKKRRRSSRPSEDSEEHDSPPPENEPKG